MKYLHDSKFRKPRIWSNRQLIKFKNFFYGDVLNVSGWKDEDKEGFLYKERYFKNANNYFISNYKSEFRGYQGDLENEFFLNLQDILDSKYKMKFDVVFNHTSLEHIFDINQAFKNICELSKDLVIVVVPFLQEEHGDYGDYWRFTPQAIKKLFEFNKFNLLYLNYNDHHSESIYIFAIASRKEKKNIEILNMENNKINTIGKNLIGKKIIKNNTFKKLYFFINNFLKND